MDDFQIQLKRSRPSDSVPVARPAGPEMDLKLSVSLPDAAVQDLLIQCPDTLTVSELATYLMQRFGPTLSRDHFSLSSVRVGRLPDDEPVGAADLINGDEVSVVRESSMQFGGRTVSLSLGDEVSLGGGTGIVGRTRGTLRFNRPPRIADPEVPISIQFPSPPTQKDTRPLQYAAMLIPVALGAVMAIALRQPLYMIFMLMSPIMLLATWVSDKQGDKKSYKIAQLQYRTDLVEFERQLFEALNYEVKRRRAESPSIADIAWRARERSPELWERRQTDADFLSLGVGSCLRPTRTEVKAGSEIVPTGVHHLYTGLTIDEVPMVVGLPDAGVVGLSGSDERVNAAARWLVAQAACLHDPSELAIVALVADPAQWDWLKWLPHVDGRSVGLDRVAVTTDPDQIERSVRSLRGLARNRAEAAQGGMRSLGDDRNTYRGRWVMLVVDEDAPFDSVEMARLLDQLGEHGTVCLWLGSNERMLPGSCGKTLVYEGDHGTLRVTDVRTGERQDGVTPDVLGVDDCLRLARNLAPIHVVQKDEGGFGLPEFVSTASANEMQQISPREIANRWHRSPPGLRVVLGESSTGTLAIDLERDGPHGLVAGTTGSGKSEFMQNFVAGLAINYSPDRVNFLFVDYKGGTAFKDCVQFPHSVGMVTDLDAHLASRVLVSLGAEIRRRERLLGDRRAKDLKELREIAPAASVPNLLIVVDEFAALVSEVPEFMGGLIDIAQRGRSLGINLILSTQKPGGSVSPAIRANTNLRVALQTANEAESSDIIDAPDAARISRDTRGRAFIRLGHDELIEFQSAYAGAALQSGAAQSVRISPFSLTRPVRGTVAGENSDASGASELQAFSDAMSRAANDIGAHAADAPWLPPLPEVVPLSELPPATSQTPVAIGMIDKPAQQLQSPLELDLATWGNAIVYGVGASGKTTFLRTVAAALSSSGSPDEIAVYGLDCAGQALGDIQALPNVGSVVPADDQERTHRLIRMLRETIDRRAFEFAEAGVTDLDSFRRSKSTAVPEPRMVLLLDSYAGFTDRYDTVGVNPLTEQIPRLIAEGPAVGVHAILTGDRRMAIPLSVASLVSRKFVLQMAGHDEELALGVPPDIAKGPRRLPGRAVTEEGLEVQIAIVGELPGRDAQSLAVGELAEQLADRWRGSAASPIATLPTEIPLSSLPVLGEQWGFVLGVDDASMYPLSCHLDYAHMVVAGPYRSGRTSALETIARGIKASTPAVDIEIFTPKRSSLRDAQLGATVHSSPTLIDEGLTRIANSLEDRDHNSSPLLVVIDDAIDLPESPASTAALERILRDGTEVGVRVVAAFEPASMRLSFQPWVRELRKHKFGLLLDPDHDLDGDLLGARLPRTKGGALPSGRGYLIQGGHAKLCQVALPEQPAIS